MANNKPAVRVKTGEKVTGTKRNLILVDGHVWDMDTEKWIKVCPVCMKVFHATKRNAVTCSARCRQRWSRYRKALYAGDGSFDAANHIARQNREFFNTQMEMEL